MTALQPSLEKPARRAPLTLHQAESLLAEYGSPLYVYDETVLLATLKHITAAVPYPHTQFHFASVTNGNLALLQIIRAFGWGLHANTPGDVRLGLHAGFAPEQIVYSGSNLLREEMQWLLEQRIAALNLDSVCQLETLLSIPSDFRPRLGFRLNIPEIVGDNRIGVRPAELPHACAMARDAGCQITGLHFYRGTGTNQTSAFTDSIARVLEVGQTLPDWEYLDFGGGFGYPYRAGQTGFSWEDFGAALTDQLTRLPHPIKLIIEPGRAAVAACGSLLAHVVAVKWQGEKQIVGLNTSVANIAVLSVHGGHREIGALKESTSTSHITDLVGNTTFSRDYLGRNCNLPALSVGDVVAILDVGAYGYAMASHFLHRPRPAEVLLSNGSSRLIRQREDYEALFALQTCYTSVNARSV